MNNIYEDRKTCTFCVLSLVKPTKMSWNFVNIGSWNFTSCSWEPWEGWSLRFGSTLGGRSHSMSALGCHFYWIRHYRHVKTTRIGRYILRLYTCLGRIQFRTSLSLLTFMCRPSNICVLLRRRDISPARGRCSPYWLQCRSLSIGGCLQVATVRRHTNGGPAGRRLSTVVIKINIRLRRATRQQWNGILACRCR